MIGTRTWGGWIGIRGDKTLRDGGVTTQPEFGGWDPQGKEWQIEGHGVDPDVELDLPPEGFLGGSDAQLDYAIRDLMEKIKKDPMSYPAAPPIRPRPLVPVSSEPPSHEFLGTLAPSPGHGKETLDESRRTSVFTATIASDGGRKRSPRGRESGAD